MTQKRVTNMSWTGFVQPALQALPAASKVIVGSFVLDTAFDETLLRTRGAMLFNSDQIAAGEEVIGALGMILVSEDAFAAGIASIPSPVNDIDNDGWVLWHPVVNQFRATQSSQQVISHFDSKAKRIVRQGSLSDQPLDAKPQ